MRPLRLEIEAFGSFAGHQTIDFEALGERRLLLVHGPTGAGKSTLLEAISYALYGAAKSSGDGPARHGSYLRSQHADADRATRVRFEFALGSDRYRVERTPRQRRPSRRGGREVEDRPTALLYRIAGANRSGSLPAAGRPVVVDTAMDDRSIAPAWGAPLASKPSDVDERIRELLGLDRSQFRQVILLPQGEFRRLLEAPSAERQAILAQLFDIERYAVYERVLKTAAEGVREELDRLEDRRVQLLRSADFESQEAFALCRKELAEEIHALAQTLEEREASRTRAHEAEDRAKVDAERIMSKMAAAERFDRLDARRPEMENLRQRLREAERAEPVALVLDQLEARRHAFAAAQSRSGEAERARVDAEQLLERARQAELRAREAEPELRRMSEQTASLQRAQQTVAELEALRSEQVAESERARASGRATMRLRDAVGAAERDCARFEEEIALREQAAREVPHWRAAVERLEALDTLRLQERQHVDRVRSVERKLEELGERMARDRAQADAAERTLRTALQNDDARVTLRLAERLEAGEPCPVCGSKEHPSPAEGARADVEPASLEGRSLAELDARAAEARRRLADTRERWARRGAEHVAERRQLADVEAQIATATWRIAESSTAWEKDSAGAATGDAPVGSSVRVAAHELAAARERLTNAKRAVEAAEAARERLGQARDRVTRLRGEQTASAHEAAQLDARLAERARSIARLEADLPSGVRTQSALKERLATVAKGREALTDRITRAEEAVREAEQDVVGRGVAVDERAGEARRAEGERVRAEEALSVALARSGFAGAADVRAACLSEADREEETRRLEAFDGMLEAARRGLAESARAAASAIERAPGGDRDAIRGWLEEAKTASRAADHARDACRDELMRLRERDRVWQGLAKNLERNADRAAELHPRYERVGLLARVASGENPSRISFQRFVLSAFLDEVLVLASSSLRRMSKGRYDLRRVSTALDRRRGAGLDLAVWDGHTGQERPVATLSGGESFCAALALALGLAEVVQRHSGGTRLDAIFVDEGFGSLDPESLELALETLVELQSGGRLVGLISHVPELKERIDTRIEVLPGRGGSRLRFEAL